MQSELATISRHAHLGAKGKSIIIEKLFFSLFFALMLVPRASRQLILPVSRFGTVVKVPPRPGDELVYARMSRIRFAALAQVSSAQDPTLHPLKTQEDPLTNPGTVQIKKLHKICNVPLANVHHVENISYFLQGNPSKRYMYGWYGTNDQKILGSPFDENKHKILFWSEQQFNLIHLQTCSPSPLKLL